MKGDKVMRKVLLCIHGRSNKPEPKTLLKWWKASIDEGLKKNCDTNLSGVIIDMAYYSDIKNGPPIPDSKNTQPYQPATRNALKEYDITIADKIRDWTGDWLDSPLDWIEEKSSFFSKAARGILATYLEDMAAYYKDQAVRATIQNRLKEKFDEYKDHEIILISHSMGTIVAYEVLREFGRDSDWLNFNVSHFITIGSPLGLTPIKGQLLSENNKKLRTPTAVKNRWVNFSDPQDIVAIDSHLRDDYADNSLGVKVRDILVANDYPKNPHKSYGYLRTPEFSKYLVNLI